MNNYEKIYWLTRLDSLNNLFETMIILGTILAIGILIFMPIIYMSSDMMEEKINPKKIIRRCVTWGAILFVIGGLGASFTPTKNEMIMIYAGGATMDYIGKDTSLSKIPYQTTAIISEYLDKEIKELKEGKK